MTLSTLPVSYCTNVHPAQTVAEVERGLDEFTVPIQKKLGRPLAAGLWLAHPVVVELLADGELTEKFAGRLKDRGLVCYTLNSFPYGDFHSARVKEKVYLPDWTSGARLEYTVDCATILSRLLGDGREGSLSTVPLGFKGFEHAPDFADQCIQKLIECADHLDRIAQTRGKVIRLAVEPEPYCVLETTPETIEFFEKLYYAAATVGCRDIVERHIGLCYDVCHQAVEFEDPAEAIRQLTQAGIRLNKVHISCAIDAPNPVHNDEVRAALLHYVEPRYLHQTFCRSSDGLVHRLIDLTAENVVQPPEAFRAADRWRVHFHVPVNARDLGPLATTRPDLERALAAVRDLDYAPHLEVETYTWEVLPGGGRPNVVTGLAAELQATHELLGRL